MDTPARLLRLLVLLSSRARWSAEDLVGRLEVTPRTLRRDVTRLRDLGYPVHSTRGPFGGYELGAGGRLPPLMLDDDEAVAAAVALGDLSGRAAALGDAALSALTKLGQVLPPTLRERVGALGAVTVGIDRVDADFHGDGTRVEMGTLVAVALACRRSERLRFTYSDNNDNCSSRLTEPHRLVAVRQRWYLVAFDLDRRDWRTFRVDRIKETSPTGVRFVHVDPPDAATLVAEGVAVRVYDTSARLRVHLPPDRTMREIPATVGIVEPAEPDATTTIVQIGGDLDWIARYIARFPFDIDVLEPDELKDELRALGERLIHRHARGPTPARVAASVAADD